MGFVDEMRTSSKKMSQGNYDMSNPALGELGKTIKCVSIFWVCTYMILYVALCAVFAMTYASVWKPCYLNSLETFPAPTSE